MKQVYWFNTVDVKFLISERASSRIEKKSNQLSAIYKIKKYFIFLFLAFCIYANSQNAPQIFQNPIIAGFAPDPSICRVEDDYYLVTSSFAWFPGIPIYHSKDLVNWELIGHGINRPEQLNFDGIKDKNGIWAVTIRYHEGLFYLITTCSECGGNFYITAKNPAGNWSDPVWLENAKGIDPSLFWDEDGTCYYTGNDWDFEKSWPGQCAIWQQELDLQKQKLVGNRKILTYGHANNARNTEAPHIYKIDGKYLLITAEGGTNKYHAVTAHHNSSLSTPYISDRINPVLSHRHFGDDYPIQAVGHADLVQTQNGEWWGVVLGKRQVDGVVTLARETFLCRVKFENETPIINPGYGKVLLEQERPDLLWTPIKPEPFRDNFNSGSLSLAWHTIRIPEDKFFQLENNSLTMNLRPQVVDSLVNSSLLLQRIRHHQFTASTKLDFSTSKRNEQAGLIIYRTNESYYMLMKEKNKIKLFRKFDGEKEVVAEVPYNKPEVYFKINVDRLALQFSYGESLDTMNSIGDIQSMVNLSENEINKFNGTGVGMYVTSNGLPGKAKAQFDWFEYKY